MRKAPTRRSRRWAVAASSWAEAAISWVEAEVSSVEAETSSAEAEDSSATAATSTMSVWMRPVPSEICSTAAAISSTRAVTSTTAVSMPAKAARLLGGAGAGLGALDAALDDAHDARGLVADLADQRPRSSPRRSGALGELRTSSATTAKPLPCSPARAASMAALSASRLVCSASAEMVSTIDSISLERAARSRIAAVTSGGGALHAGHRLERLLRGGRAGAGDVASLVGGAGGLAGRSTLWRDAAASSAVSRTGRRCAPGARRRTRRRSPRGRSR